MRPAAADPADSASQPDPADPADPAGAASTARPAAEVATDQADGEGGDGRQSSTAAGDTASTSEAADLSEPVAAGSDAGEDQNSPGERSRAGPGRIIRPAGFMRLRRSAGEPAPEQDDDTPGDRLDGVPVPGPRDYSPDEARDEDLDAEYGGRYIPPPVPPQPRLDPVAKAAWMALFGGQAYLLFASLIGWQIAGWQALACVVAFVSGFVILVIRLGDGPSKRDGPDQGAVV